MDSLADKVIGCGDVFLFISASDSVVNFLIITVWLLYSDLIVYFIFRIGSAYFISWKNGCFCKVRGVCK